MEENIDIDDKVEEKVDETDYKEAFMLVDKQLQEYQFFSNQVKVNALLYQGMTLILEKLTKLEQKQDGS